MFPISIPPFCYTVSCPCFWFCIFATLVFSVCFHLWICLLIWLVPSFLVPSYSFLVFFFVWVWVSLCVPVWLMLLLPFFGGFCLSVLPFVCRLAWFFPYFFLSFPFCTVRLVESWCSSKGSGLNLWGGSSNRLCYLNPGCWTTRESLIASSTNWWELFQKLNTKTWPHLRPARSSARCPMPNN